MNGMWFIITEFHCSISVFLPQRLVSSGEVNGFRQRQEFPRHREDLVEEPAAVELYLVWQNLNSDWFQ